MWKSKKPTQTAKNVGLASLAYTDFLVWIDACILPVRDTLNQSDEYKKLSITPVVYAFMNIEMLFFEKD
ncbi:hypothetical protein [Brevibacillus laterosporus]|uniref:hypothetical protein n=1 Tax=Brevibacillus laterosporus TaxID=1465 RepID=UPI003D1B191E